MIDYPMTVAAEMTNMWGLKHLHLPMAIALSAAVLAAAATGRTAETPGNVKHITTPIKPLSAPKWSADGVSYSFDVDDPEHGRTTLKMRITQVTAKTYTVGAEGTDYEQTAPLPAEHENGVSWILAWKKRQLGSPLNANTAEALVRFCIDSGYLKHATSELAALAMLSKVKRAEMAGQIRAARTRQHLEAAREQIRAGRFEDAGRLITQARNVLAQPEPETSAPAPSKSNLKKLSDEADALQVSLSSEARAQVEWDQTVGRIRQALKGAEGKEAELIKQLLPDLDGPMPGSRRREILRELHLANRRRINYTDALDALKAFSFHVRYAAVLKKSDLPDIGDFFDAEAAINAYLDCPRDASPKELKEKLDAALSVTSRGFTDQVVEALVRFGQRAGPPPTPEPGRSPQGPFKLQGQGDELEVRLEYLIYLPPDYHPAVRRPLLLILHGLKETALTELRRWYKEAQKRGWLVAAPELVIGRDKGYLADPEERQMALRTIRDCSRRFAVDPNRIFIAGHSMGGYMTWDVALTYPDRFAAAAPFSGCVSGTASNYLLHTFLVPIYCVGTSRDRKVKNINQLARQELMKHTPRNRLRNDPPMKYVEYHKKSSSGFVEEIPAVTAWMEKKIRTRYPRNVEFASADAETTRVHWLEMVLHRVKKPRTTAQGSLQRLKPSLHASGTSTLAGEVLGRNEVRIRARKATGVRIYASRDLFDFRAPMRVAINGKPARIIKLDPSRRRLLEITRLIGDRERQYWCSVDLPVPK